MTDIQLHRRLATIAVTAVALGIANLTVHLESPYLARATVPDYRPLTSEQLESRVRAGGDCRTPMEKSFGIRGQGPCSPESIDWDEQLAQFSAGNRAEWESDVLMPALSRFKDGMITLFSIAYALLFLMAVLAYFQWAAGRLSGTLQRGIAGAKNSRAALNEAMAMRRVHQTEKDFLSLKTFCENGLLTEQEFLKRKSELAAGLQR